MKECNSIGKVSGILLAKPDTEFHRLMQKSDNRNLSYDERHEAFKNAINHLKANLEEGLFVKDLNELDN